MTEIKFYTNNMKITPEVVNKATEMTVAKDYRIGMENRPINQIKFNEIGWFEFQSTAYAVLNNQEYFLYCSTYTGQIYKVAGKYINQ